VALLSFFERGDRVFRYLVLRGRVIALWPLDRRATGALVIRTRDELEHGALDGSRAEGLLLSLQRWALGGVLGRLAGVRGLVLVPDGVLVAAPFQGLVLRRRPLRFVAEDLVLTRAPCMGLLRRAGPGQGRARVVVPVYGQDPRHLAGARAEAGLLAGALARVGRQARPGVLERDLAEGRGVVHFAGHGLADLEHGEPPELEFPAGQRPVTVRSATRRPVRAALVVLSSCATAHAARFRDGRRLLAQTTLPDALLAAGAGAVVAAPWTVKDRWSARELAVFYRHLARLGPARALGRAKRRGIATLEPPHPRFWAAYSLYGGW
jgi:hypothetical protein